MVVGPPEPCMCRLLHVHSSGFDARLKNPLSRRANKDKRKIDLLLKAWEGAARSPATGSFTTTFSTRTRHATRTDGKFKAAAMS